MMNSLNVTEDLVQEVIGVEIIAHNFYFAMEGKMDEVLIQLAKNQMVSTGISYPARVGVIIDFQVNIDKGKTFHGSDFGSFTSGGDTLFGDVCTDDIDRLYRDTVSFQFTSTSIYLRLIFFDNNSNNLGTFLCGSLSKVLGVGTGLGSWY